jgi:hypothetical protein
MDLSMKLVGFDARTTLASGWEAWSADRRDKYLLRREVAKPLSVDAMIWPPVFSRSQAPKWTGALGLWENLRSLEEELLAQDAALTHPYRVVAVTLLWELLTSGERARWNEPPKFTATEPGELDSAWRFLGYDVADMFLTSGLSNCAWSPDEMHRARNTWGRR